MILDIIKELRADSGKIYKEKTIAKYADNEAFKKVLSATYDPRIKFGIKVIPEYTKGCETLFMDDALFELEALSNREITGNSAQEHLAKILANLNEDNAEVVKLIIGQSLEIGCGASTINKALGKNFIKDTPYCGCSSFSMKKMTALFASKKTVFSQIKMDGRFMNLRILDDMIMAESRQGLETPFGATFEPFKVFQALNNNEPLVLNGELLIEGVSRYESNGIIASLVSIGDKISLGEDVTKELAKLEKKHGDSYDNYLSKLAYVVWDYIPNSIYIGSDTWEVPYSVRLAKLNEMVNASGLPNVRAVESRVVSTIDEAMAHYQEAVARGEEGTVVKGDREWKDTKPTYNLKVKVELATDLVITGYNFGSGKNEGVISSLNVQASCGMLKTSPAGIDEATMATLTQMGDELIGRIVEVKCNGLSQDREGNYSMLHPVFLRLRDDKTVADTLEKCIEIETAAKEIS